MQTAKIYFVNIITSFGACFRLSKDNDITEDFGSDIYIPSSPSTIEKYVA